MFMVDIHISADELRSPKVAEALAREAAMQNMDAGTFIEDVDRPLIYNPMFYYSIAAALMAFVAWVIMEPFIDDMAVDESPLIGFMLFMMTAALVGLGLGVVYGVSNRNGQQSAYCGAVGFGIGFIAAIPATFLGGLFFVGGNVVAALMLEEKEYTIYTLPPLAFFILMCSRSMAWALVASTAGVALGISLKSSKILTVGLIGGIVGGAIGGLFFDPVDRFLSYEETNAALSRMVGLTAVGFMTGLFVGYVENISKSAWLQMLRGPLMGKQFNLFKSPMIIGSAPQADIYLFKDPGISPKHASITVSGAKFVLTDLNSPSGVHVNGRRVNKTVLQKGDVVTLGQTVLKYNDKEARK